MGGNSSKPPRRRCFPPAPLKPRITAILPPSIAVEWRAALDGALHAVPALSDFPRELWSIVIDYYSPVPPYEMIVYHKSIDALFGAIPSNVPPGGIRHPVVEWIRARPPPEWLLNSLFDVALSTEKPRAYYYHQTEGLTIPKFGEAMTASLASVCDEKDEYTRQCIAAIVDALMLVCASAEEAARGYVSDQALSAERIGDRAMQAPDVLARLNEFRVYTIGNQYCIAPFSAYAASLTSYKHAREHPVTALLVQIRQQWTPSHEYGHVPFAD